MSENKETTNLPATHFVDFRLLRLVTIIDVHDA